MKTHFVDTSLPYTGDALSNHWAYRNFGILGDSVVAFAGPCDVGKQSMVDLEDVLNDDFIYSANMLHFIVELFGPTLREGVLLQRLFVSVLENRLNAELGQNAIQRRGDDLFFQGSKKLSVSICTLSPTSILIHTGLNINAMGAPVEAAGLNSELGLPATAIQPFAQTCMNLLANEWEDVHRALCKVRAVS
jgi:uncharacterized protein